MSYFIDKHPQTNIETHFYNTHNCHFHFHSGEQLGNAAGTPAFMSPELCAAEAFSGQVTSILN